MGVRTTSSENKVALFDSVTGRAFGPVFDSNDDIESFLEYAETMGTEDLRCSTDDELETMKHNWEQSMEENDD